LRTEHNCGYAEVQHNRKNWLFAGSLRAGKRAAAIMSLIQSARLNGHEPFAYLKDVLTRLPTQPQSRIGELLPSIGGLQCIHLHRFEAASACLATGSSSINTNGRIRPWR
jgi:transposase